MIQMMWFADTHRARVCKLLFVKEQNLREAKLSRTCQLTPKLSEPLTITDLQRLELTLARQKAKETKHAARVIS